MGLNQLFEQQFQSKIKVEQDRFKLEEQLRPLISPLIKYRGIKIKSQKGGVNTISVERGDTDNCGINALQVYYIPAGCSPRLIFSYNSQQDRVYVENVPLTKDFLAKW